MNRNLISFDDGNADHRAIVMLHTCYTGQLLGMGEERPFTHQPKYSQACRLLGLWGGGGGCTLCMSRGVGVPHKQFKDVRVGVTCIGLQSCKVLKDLFW